MKVLMLSEYPKEEDDQAAGGIMQATFQLVEGFKKINIDFELCILSFSKSVKKYSVLKEKNITYHFVPHKNNFFSQVFFGPISYLFFLIKLNLSFKPDIVHGQGTVTYILLSLFFGKHNIQTVHGIYVNEHKAIESSERSFLLNVKFFLKERIENLYLTQIKHLIIITNEIEYLVKSKSNKLINIFKINNPIDINFFNSSKNFSTKDNIEILFVAAITPRKGLHHLLQAFELIHKSNPNIRAKIVGMWDWAPKYVENLMKKYSNLIKLNKLIFTGSVSRNKLQDYFNSSNIFVLPSLAESAPMVISQAMCCGLSIISTKVGGIPEMIQNNEDGLLVEPNDPKALKIALQKLIESNDLRILYSKNARIKGYNRYHPVSVAKQTVQAYRSVISGEELK